MPPSAPDPSGSPRAPEVTLEDAPPSSWPDLWAADPRATLFLHPRWMKALTRAYPSYRPRYLVARDHGDVVGLLPLVQTSRLGMHRILSLPFGTHGGPLLAARAPAGTAPSLAREVLRLATRPRTVRFEMTVYDPPAALREALEPSLGEFFQDFRTHVVDLTVSFRELWEHRYFKNTRNCVRMAERGGVTVAVERGREAVGLLARLYAEQSKGWAGIVPYPEEVLQAVVDTLGDDARIYVARHEGKPLAACFNLEHDGTEVHPWASGQDPEGRPLRAFHLLIHTAIKEAQERGFKTWNFGGSGGIKKVEFFKESFAGRPVSVLRCFRVAGWRKRIGSRTEWD